MATTSAIVSTIAGEQQIRVCPWAVGPGGWGHLASATPAFILLRKTGRGAAICSFCLKSMQGESDLATVRKHHVTKSFGDGDHA